ncbi:MAG: NifB/NifX family molybdenum-iron cluster-binding protein [Nitrospirota bacterium]
MKICFPVEKDEGINSTVYNHFGSAPAFIIVDSDTNSMVTINNCDQHHAHGACNPMKALDNQKIDALVVGGIGTGALVGLNRTGIRVYRSQAATIQENSAMFKNGTLTELTPDQCCGGHGSGGGCAH